MLTSIDGDIITVTAIYDGIAYSGKSDNEFDYYLEKDGKYTKVNFIQGHVNYNLEPKKKVEMVYTEAKRQLGQDFGTRRTKTMLKNIEKNAVKEETLSALQRGMDTGNVEVIVDEPMLNNIEQLMPNYDPTATKIEDVFNLDDIVRPELLKEINIKHIITNFENEEVLKSKISSLSLYSYQHILRLSRAAELNIEQIRWYIFIDMLIKLFKTNSRMNMNIINIKKALMCAPEIAEYIMSEFTEFTTDENAKFKHILTKKVKQKVLNYLFILILIMENFTCYILNSPGILSNDGVENEVSALLKDLQFSIPRLIERFVWVGCTVEIKSKKQAAEEMKDRLECPFQDGKWPALRFIQLKAPLTLPQ